MHLFGLLVIIGATVNGQVFQPHEAKYYTAKWVSTHVKSSQRLLS
jgi:hypothetical protein